MNQPITIHGPGIAGTIKEKHRLEFICSHVVTQENPSPEWMKNIDPAFVQQEKEACGSQSDSSVVSSPPSPSSPSVAVAADSLRYGCRVEEKEDGDRNVESNDGRYWLGVRGWIPYHAETDMTMGVFSTEQIAISRLAHAPPPPGWKEPEGVRPPAPFGCPTYYDAGHDSSRCGHCRGRDRVWNGSKWAATDEAKPASPGLRAAGEVANEIYYSPPMFNGRCAVLTADRRSTLDHFVGWLKEDTTIIRFPTMKDAHAAYKKEFLS